MTIRAQVRDFAQDQYGYITTRDAAGLGVPAVELRKLTARGGLDRIGHGLYRMTDVRPTDLDQYAEAVLRVGPGAHLTQDAVLALHHLALVNPRRIKVGTPHRVRVTLPAFVQVVHEHVPAGDLAVYEGIPSTTVARALIDCRGLVMNERLREALKDAQRSGLLTPREAARVRAMLRQPADRPAG